MVYQCEGNLFLVAFCTYQFKNDCCGSLHFLLCILKIYMNSPVHQLKHFMAVTDDPQTIQKQNYVLQLYDETETHNILYHKFSSRCYVPYEMSVVNIFSN